MQGTSSAMSRVLGSLMAAPGAAFNVARDGVGSIAETLSESFGASNIARAVLPPILGDAASRFLDRRRRKKDEARAKAESDDEDEDEISDASPESTSDSREEIGEVVNDIDLSVDDLAEAIEAGFDDTNENLDRIFDILSDQEEEQESETKSTLELVGVNGQILSRIDRIDDRDATKDLIAVNERILDAISEIEANTSPNELDVKLAHHNQRKLAGQEAREKTSDKITDKKKGPLGSRLGGHVLTKFLEGVGETFLGTALASGFGATVVPKVVSRFFGKKVDVPASTVADAAKKPGIMSKVSGALGSAKNAVVERVGAFGTSAKNSVAAVSRGAMDWASNAKSAAANAVSGGAKSIADNSKSLLSASKKIAAPLMIAATGYQAYDIASSDRSAEEKSKEYTKLASGTGGMLVGAKVGAALGALTGPLAPIAVPVLGILGGALGYMGGEKTGEVGHDLMMGDNSSSIKEKLTKAFDVDSLKSSGGVDYSSVMNYSPEIRSGDVIANSSKTERLDNLTKQIEYLNADNQAMTSQTNIVPVQINTTPSAPQQSTQQEQKTFHIPATRNQDGTIQRLLDDNFTPMFR